MSNYLRDRVDKILYRPPNYDDEMIARHVQNGPPNWERAAGDMSVAFRLWGQEMRRSPDVPDSEVDAIVSLVRGGTILNRWADWHFNEATAAENAGVSLERARRLLSTASSAGFLSVYPDDLHGGCFIRLGTGK